MSEGGCAMRWRLRLGIGLIAILCCVCGGCEEYPVSKDDFLVATPGVGVPHFCEIGMRWDCFVRTFAGECERMDPNYPVELPKYNMTVYFSPTNKSGVCYMIAFKTNPTNVVSAAGRKVRFSWSNATRFNWKDVYAQFGEPRKIPRQMWNVLGGRYPCCFELNGEKWVDYAKEGVLFKGAAGGVDVDEVDILKKLDQDWDEREREAARSFERSSR